MGRYRITKPGIFGPDGELPVGTECTLSEEPKGWGDRYIDLDAPVTSAHVPATGEGAPLTYSAVEGTGGWWKIVDSAGNQIGKGIRKDEAEEFNELSDEDKATAVEAHGKDA